MSFRFFYLPDYIIYNSSISAIPKFPINLSILGGGLDLSQVKSEKKSRRSGELNNFRYL